MLSFIKRALREYLYQSGLALYASPAQGLFKTVSVAKQAGLGTPMTAASSATYLRRKSSVWQATRDTTTVDEIVSHRQDTGIVYGQKKTGGKIDGNLSAGTWAPLMAGALMGTFGTIASYSLGTDATAATTGVVTDPTANFLTAGLKAGDVGQFAGFTTTATPNNSRNFVITNLGTTTLTGKYLDSSVMVSKIETGAVTFTVTGKKVKVPLTGHTNDFFTFEEWFSDKSLSEMYPDCKPNKIDISIPAAGAAQISLDIMGVGTRTAGVAQAQITPVAETTTGVLQAVLGAIYVNGTALANVTSLSLSIDRGLTPIGASIGSAVAPDFNQGRIKVSGSFTAMYNDATIQALYDAQSAISLIVVIAADTTATSDFMAFTLGRIKLQGDAPDDGEKVISRTYPFTAEINGNGGPSLAWDKTIITIQDSQA